MKFWPFFQNFDPLRIFKTKRSQKTFYSRILTIFQNFSPTIIFFFKIKAVAEEKSCPWNSGLKMSLSWNMPQSIIEGAQHKAILAGGEQVLAEGQLRSEYRLQRSMKSLFWHLSSEILILGLDPVLGPGLRFEHAMINIALLSRSSRLKLRNGLT